MKPRVLAVGGPTATGKTAFGVLLAKTVGGEVVSCDSMQLYKGMVIGTAAPTPEETEGVPHHMVGVVDPVIPFSVADYCAMAAPILADIHARGLVPVVVGGTGLYMDCLLSGMTFLGQEDTGEVRRQLWAQDGEALWKRLAELDPQAAAAIHPANKKRVIRALEVVLTTGETMTARAARQSAAESPYEVTKICLDIADREVLRARCERRVDEMMEKGLLEEVEELLKRPGLRVSTAFQSIGYKELATYFDGILPLERAVEDIKTATKKYAKRQRSWFRRDGAALWYYRDQLSGEAIIDDLRQRNLL
ncbi:MAG TPA: tRNA (adenosine(37)-N6)-dimethylallyltransferase MiaA [Terriglobales bacterium]|nr:tRNA (adenosine(37)-N6)-dimethylallyltransferase MiaA [Terriglobales bacterium]